MAVTFAVRFDSSSMALYDPRTADRRQHRVALGAVRSQLVTLVNALVRDNRPWHPEPPSIEAFA